MFFKARFVIFCDNVLRLSEVTDQLSSILFSLLLRYLVLDEWCFDVVAWEKEREKFKAFGRQSKIKYSWQKFIFGVRCCLKQKANFDLSHSPSCFAHESRNRLATFEESTLDGFSFGCQHGGGWDCHNLCWLVLEDDIHDGEYKSTWGNRSADSHDAENYRVLCCFQMKRKIESCVPSEEKGLFAGKKPCRNVNYTGWVESVSSGFCSFAFLRMKQKSQFCDFLCRRQKEQFCVWNYFFTQLLRKGRKCVECSFRDVMPVPTYKHFGTIKTTSASQSRRSRIPSKYNPPPELAEWLRTFEVKRSQHSDLTL